MAECEPLTDRLGAERGEQRAEDRGVLERAERDDEDVEPATEQREHRLAGSHAEVVEHVGEGRTAVREVAVGGGADRLVRRHEPHRYLVSGAVEHVPVDRLVSDVEPPTAGKAVEPGPGSGPDLGRRDAPGIEAHSRLRRFSGSSLLRRRCADSVERYLISPSMMRSRVDLPTAPALSRLASCWASNRSRSSMLVSLQCSWDPVVSPCSAGAEHPRVVGPESAVTQASSPPPSGGG